MTDRPTILAEHFAVIGRNDHQGMVEQAGRFQLIQNGGDGPVHVKQFVQIQRRKIANYFRLKFFKLSWRAIKRVVRGDGKIRQKKICFLHSIILDLGADRIQGYLFFQAPGNWRGFAQTGHGVGIIHGIQATPR